MKAAKRKKQNEQQRLSLCRRISSLVEAIITKSTSVYFNIPRESEYLRSATTLSYMCVCVCERVCGNPTATHNSRAISVV